MDKYGTCSMHRVQRWRDICGQCKMTHTLSLIPCGFPEGGLETRMK